MNTYGAITQGVEVWLKAEVFHEGSDDEIHFLVQKSQSYECTFIYNWIRKLT